MRRVLLLILLLSLVVSARATEPLRVAVASNFTETLDALIRAYRKQQPEWPVQRVSGSTGKLYAQIVNGAPYDLFLAADVERPRRLETEGRTVVGSRFTYAIGQLVLWSPDPQRVDARGDILRRGDFRFLAMANPKLAPYGRAARQLLESLGLWQSLRPRTVRGENVSQAYHFVVSGNAPLGLVAWSQIQRPVPSPTGSWWLPPTALYDPVEQQAVRLTDSEAARDFHRFLTSDTARRIIRARGYATP